MQFLYDPNAGQKQLYIEGENYRYLFKVRRFKKGENVLLRNLKDSFAYRYKIVGIDRRRAEAVLVEKEASVLQPKRHLHLIWCIIDMKVVEKTLPMLNQIGVSKITFVYCERSQKNFRPDFARFEKILINSCQQCGRTDLMQLETMMSLDEVTERYGAFAVLDFGGSLQYEEISAVLIGCEGGFTEAELEKLASYRKIGLDTDYILKSETAAVSIAAKLLI